MTDKELQMVNSYEVIRHPATTEESSPTQGQVAPPRVEQDQGVAPGAGQDQPQRQPAPQQGQPVASGNQQSQQQAETPASSQQERDYRAEWERERAARERLQGQTREYQNVISQVQQYAANQQENQALQNQVNMILATADNMPSSEGTQYLRNQITNLVGQTRLSSQQQLQQREQQHQQEIRTVAAGPYADHLITSMGIPPEAKQELLNLGDPDLMFRQAPVIKERYDKMTQMQAAWEAYQQQQGRSQEVNRLRENGLANVGGQSAGAAYEIDIDDGDPDVAAMQILNGLREMEHRMSRGGD